MAYVNQFVEPAFLNRDEIASEVDRLSARYGQKPRKLEAQKGSSTPQALIATWGALQLTPLPDPDMAVIRDDGSVTRGILVDYLGDFTRSAQAGLPVFSIQGGAGYAWAASYDEQGRGKLRFFAINAARLSSARLRPDPSGQAGLAAPSGTPRQADGTNSSAAKAVPTTQPTTLERQLQECGESCPGRPELDKTRLDALAELDRANRMKQDAERFAAAIGNEQAIAEYISSCADQCAFRSEAVDGRNALQREGDIKLQAQLEDGRYRQARGDLKALKQYVANCEVCAFAREALDEINQKISKSNNRFFDLEVCNQDFLSVFVSIVGKPDPYSNMWIAEGWYEVEAGKCKTIIHLVKSDFYVRAKNARATWTGDAERRFCTQDGKRFTRVLPPDDGECLDDERAVKFGEKHVGEDSLKYTWTLNSKPWAFSAFAYSPSNKAWSWAADQPSAEDARNKALELCGENAMDCQIGRLVRDDVCFALASGTTSEGERAMGWASGGTDVRDAANRGCRNADGRFCRVVKFFCNTLSD